MAKFRKTVRANNAAEIYEVQADFKRFDHKYNMTRRGLWIEEAAALFKTRVANLRQHVSEEKNGYGLRDWGFFAGARANLENTGFNVNRPNWRGNSWDPLAKRRISGYPAPPRSFSNWEGSPEEATKMLRKMCTGYYGADMVGFCNLDRRWVYSHGIDDETKEEYAIKFSDEAGYEGYTEPTQLEDKTQVIPKEMKYVVVLIYEMDQDAIATAPTLTAMAGTQTTYARISHTTVSIAEFIRGLGYNAIPSANCTALNIPLAIDAGMGQLGRNAKLITPWFGPRCRISKVITDLPVTTATPIELGVTEFCNRCAKCAQHCPAGAIPFGDRSFEPVNDANNRGVLQWQLDHKKCAQYSAKVGTNCGICIRVCPFNKGKAIIHAVSRWVIKTFPFLDPVFVKMDDIFGYGEFLSPQNFWQKD